MSGRFVPLYPHALGLMPLRDGRQALVTVHREAGGNPEEGRVLLGVLRSATWQQSGEASPGWNRQR